MQEVYIVDGLRSPIGDFGGALKDLTANELASQVVKGLVQRHDLQENEVDELILGNCIQRTDEPNIARVVAIKAGLGIHTTGFTVQRQCSSAMQAVINGFQEICLGDCKIVMAGGVEVMSQGPYYLKSARWGQRLQHGAMSDSVWEVLEDPLEKIMMGETAERLAEKYGISREEQDKLALESHQKAAAAQACGRFNEEILPISIASRKGIRLVETDEHPRSDLTLDELAALRPAFRKNGTVTAGNASSLNDGAAVLLLMAEDEVKRRQIKPRARIAGYAWAGVEPDLMGYGPVPATQKLLKKNGITLADVDLFEVNEAFAAQYLAVEKLLELERSKVNVNGSGISLGHPIGATGARIMLTMLHEMERRGSKRGLATLCVGGGMGMSVLLER